MDFTRKFILRSACSLQTLIANIGIRDIYTFSSIIHNIAVVVFTNLMWTLEYAPMRGLDNIAILTETVWEEDT